MADLELFSYIRLLYYELEAFNLGDQSGCTVPCLYTKGQFPSFLTQVAANIFLPNRFRVLTHLLIDCLTLESLIR